jgi:hypothetical protein
MRPADVARASGINQGYLSQLISGKRANASTGLLIDLAAHMPQPFQYTQFYQLPPDDAAHSLKDNAIWPIWNKATPAERELIVNLAKQIVGKVG